MISLFQTPFKLGKVEFLASIAASIVLSKVEKSYTRKTLTEFCEKPQYGYTAKATTDRVGPRLLRITDLKEGRVDWDLVPYCVCDLPDKYLLKTGDVLIGRTGSVGKSFIVEDVPEQTVFASYLIRIRTKSELRPDFLYWCLQSSYHWDQLLNVSRGSAIKNINGTMLSSLKFAIPPIDTQKSIAKFMKEFREYLLGVIPDFPDLPQQFSEQRRIVEKIDRLAAKVEEAKSIRERNDTSTVKITSGALAEIVRRLEEKYGTIGLDEAITHAGYGTSKKCFPDRMNGYTPILRIPNVISESISDVNLKYTNLSEKELKKVGLNIGDILIVRTNGSADLVGRCAVVKALNEPTGFASYLIRIHPDTDRITPDYLQRCLWYMRVSGQLFDFARTTAGQYNVSLGRIRTGRIPLPPLEEQNTIVEYLDGLQSKVDRLKKLQDQTTAELDAMFPSILDKAFKGEL